MEELFGVSWIDARGLAEYEGGPCEATSADFTIQGNGVCLTRNDVLEADGHWQFREHARLCLHPLALWLAWNFYRLSYEPIPETRSRSLPLEWALAHDMANVGEGYIWPPLTIYSDGARSVFRPGITEVESLDPVRYTSTVPLVLPVTDLQEAILRFLRLCQSRLSAQGISDAPFQQVFAELQEELQDDRARRWRKTEAMLGFDPDGAPQGFLDVFPALMDYLGEENVSELAANGERTFVSATDFKSWMHAQGIVRQPQALGLDPVDLKVNSPAWITAMASAQSLRRHLGIQGQVTDRRLAEICGVKPEAILHDGLPESLDQLTVYSADEKRLVLGAGRRPESRRFALARLLGEELLEKKDKQFSLITRSKTYRQKFQRAFAAEFLCPREEVQNRLDCDSADEEVIADIAESFRVSTYVVEHALENGSRVKDPLDISAA
ncbi:ImmA/IrrE family metallo-endopeptidase [Acidithiobacillus thiooxidans]|uniref:IrrE N-terminal-like domain-containing protein n=1 Tax=Acidithiobacillus thiooxidans ATCC 19377 TaxID=637390 RepID=A0A543Q1V7_ACITH|nr:ImmA/IrrE family metallo-endopeptidase [Acidithiobacillus thiooxidans]MDX5935531.1 ImmA/IrrE family metallo-endopeptidase [Acidithiobacillus thiooxidans]TQN50327.1 hypothetical protein DLNHIDIE_00180 [Acidithiobacillus thiooxidans ATCC 19377]